MSSSLSHSAVGPALGYYYQAVYALRLLLLQDVPDACISIESWDDVVLEKGTARQLYQLKHTIDLSKTIGIKSASVWRTLTVWLDYASAQDSTNTCYFLATVATLQSGSPLECLRDPNADRKDLRAALDAEATKVVAARAKAKLEHKPEHKWPYSDRWKDCERYLQATPQERDALLKRAALLPKSFSIHTAKEEIAKILARSVPSRILEELAKQLLAWWDREVLESLTHERESSLHVDEVRAFITKRAAELFDNGFFEDTESCRATISPSAPGITAQLDFIQASTSQRTRSTEMEMRARAQRSAWMQADVTKLDALRKYDVSLVEEWSYRFDAKCDECSGAELKVKEKHGRDLLDWTHLSAPNEVRRIDENYYNPDLVRGTYIYLSGEGAVGWHPDYATLFKKTEGKE
ncbi:ABC-three component system protein [Massilia luteola]|uniref:ABC-three component system protein n=1 Tax=Massilia luteola TaxID=3081751 RepID=UPI002ACC194E|nr:ABC-three component system protein [Massilia sp. Gc5]